MDTARGNQQWRSVALVVLGDVRGSNDLVILTLTFIALMVIYLFIYLFIFVSE